MFSELEEKSDADIQETTVLEKDNWKALQYVRQHHKAMFCC